MGVNQSFCCGLLILLIIAASAFFSGCPPPVEDPPAPVEDPSAIEHKRVDTLVGTSWVWEAWGHTIILAFQTEEKVHITNDGEVSDPPYTYTGTSKKGSITGFNSSREFSISDDGNTLIYSNWSSYGHSVDFKRQE